MRLLFRVALIAAFILPAGMGRTVALAQGSKAAPQAAVRTTAPVKESDAVAALTKLGVPLQKDPAGVVRWIEATGGELTDEAMAYLPALTQLEWLEIGGGKVTAAGAARLQGCPALRRLYIHDISLAGDELKWLAALKRLEALSLQRTGVTAAIMKNLTSPNLVVLNLSGNPVKDDVLEAAARIKGLEVLSLADTSITGAGLEKLRGMTKLNELNLVNCAIYDRDIEVFLSMPNLRIVYAEGCPLNDFGIQSVIVRFPTLAIFK